MDTDTPMECDFTKPESVVVAFMTEIAQWEYEKTQDRKNNPPSERNLPMLKDKLQKIFERYCTPKDRPYGRQGSSTPRVSGDTTIHILNVIEESSRRCAVDVEETFLL